MDQDIKKIINSAISAADPYKSVKEGFVIDDQFLEYKEQKIITHINSRVFIFCLGKAAFPMALAASEVLKDKLFSGIIVAKHEDQNIIRQLDRSIHIVYGSHPVPSESSISAAKQVAAFLSTTREGDIVVGLISGGGSSLMTYPANGLELEELQDLTIKLINCGATINEINSVRKHLDLMKGGGLLRFIAPAYSFNLLLSDVVGDDISVIASGPTCADNSTFDDAIGVLERYQLIDKVNNKIISYLRMGKNGDFPETIKKEEMILRKTSNMIIGSLNLAAQEAFIMAKKLGFQTEIMDLSLVGEAKEIGKSLARLLLDKIEKKKGSKAPLLIIAGGETYVQVKGAGKGGRNQEMALSAATILEGVPNCLFVTLATDGEDGPTDAAGGIIDGETIHKGFLQGLDAVDYLENNDAYTYLERTGCLLKTGSTGTNVNDLIFMFAF